MRISLWQQFSSNHSGFFWVVGTFKTVEEARVAYDEIRNMLIEIDRWHRANKGIYKAAMDAGNLGPLPPEAEYAQKLNVEWPTTIDWTNWANYYLQDYPGYKNLNPSQAAASLIDEAIRIVGRTVTVHNPDQTWMTTQPFEGILAHFGAQTIGYDLDFLESEASEGLDMHNRLTFVTPDVATADRLETALRNYMWGALASADNPPPWHDDVANYEKVLGTSMLLRREYLDVLTKSWQERYRLHNFPTPSPYGQRMPLERLALRSQTATLTRDYLRFTLTSLLFHNQELALSALIAYLEVNGCNDIDFQYTRTSTEE